MEQQILGAALKSRQAYDAVVASGYEFDDTGQLVFKELELYYQADPEATGTSPDIIQSRLERKYPRHKEMFDALVGNLVTVEISAPNVTAEILQAKLENIKTDLSIAFGNGKEDYIDELLEQYGQLRQGLLTPQSEVKVGQTLLEMEEESPETEKMLLLPVVMNNQLGGGASRGQHVVVFGRPDAGKTTFILNMCYGFARKQGLRVLYVGNEDPKKIVMRRYLMRLIRKPLKWIEKNSKDAWRRGTKEGVDRFIVAQPDAGTVGQIQGWVTQHKPDVVVVDQMRSLVCNEENRVQQFETLARELRRVAIRNQVLVVSVTQAGDSASGKLTLDMGDVDGSKTGIQGACDLLIGIGVNDAYLESGHRMLSFAKNKLSLDKEPLRVRMDLRRGKIS